MKKVRINRANWACGGRYRRGNQLYDRKTGGMCCLGFATNQLCNIPKEKLDDCFIPSFLPEEYISKNSLLENFGFKSIRDLSYFETFAANINDNTKLSYDRREKMLTKFFAEYNIDLEFYGEYTK